MLLLLAFVLGVVAGLRTMMPLAAVSWGAWAGLVPLDGTWLAVLGAPATPYVLSALALGELVADQLPRTPSRTVPTQFGARLVSGVLAGAALGLSTGTLVPALAGAAGAIAGTLGGAALRARMARAFGRDRPAALIEDAVAIAVAALAIAALAAA